MGQIALGFRSLLIRLAVFFVMAALLAWALGGTLFPRPEIARLGGVRFDGRDWCWQVSVGGREQGAIRWQLVVLGEDDEAMDERLKPAEIADEHVFDEVAGPVSDGTALYYAGRDATDRQWTFVRLDQARERTYFLVIDRLAVERQFARIEAGLSIQDTVQELELRPFIVDPPDSVGDGDGD